MNKRNELAKRVHANAVAKGFYENKVSVDHCLMLVITEVAELIEADREDRHADLKAYDACVKADDILADDMYCYIKSSFERLVKNTKEDEFADVAIRLYDLAGSLNVELSEKVELLHPSPMAHTFTENAFKLVRALVINAAGSRSISWALNYIHAWAGHENIDLDYFINLKINYNQTREPLHGKKY